MGSKRVGHDWVPELNWIDMYQSCSGVCQLKRWTKWELQVKFYFGQNEDFSPGDSTSDSSEDCSKEAVGEGQYIRFC